LHRRRPDLLATLVLERLQTATRPRSSVDAGGGLVFAETAAAATSQRPTVAAESTVCLSGGWAAP
jgi:hypothetical protein